VPRQEAKAVAFAFPVLFEPDFHPKLCAGASVPPIARTAAAARRDVRKRMFVCSI
jgi:hypothetical protein